MSWGKPRCSGARGSLSICLSAQDRRGDGLASGYLDSVSSRELRACARHGHVTYAPDEAALAQPLRGETALGPAWRCLRCGDWVLGRPNASGPAEQAPVPPRGRALRQLTILRLLAVERILRALVLIAAAYGVERFKSAQTALRGSFGTLVPAARPLADRLGIDLDQSTLVRDATKVLQAGPVTLTLVAAGLLLYGVLEAVEGVGLWLAKRWAEYLTVVATAAFLPLEVHELLRGVTATRVAAVALNIVAVVYLVVAKRLFGVRGGRSAYERELHSESLLEVQAAGHDATYGQRPAPAGSGREEGMSDVTAGKAEAAGF
jgi:uncharacterized membrane protein (DUF2068 family)